MILINLFKSVLIETIDITNLKTTYHTLLLLAKYDVFLSCVYTAAGESVKVPRSHSFFNEFCHSRGGVVNIQLAS